MPAFRDTRFANALNAEGDSVSKGKEDVTAKGDPDRPPHWCEAVGSANEEALVEEEKGDLGEGKADTGGDQDVVEMLRMER